MSLSDSEAHTGRVTSTSPAPSRVPKITGDHKRPIVGDYLALLSAAFYAFYVTLLKVRIRSESRINMQLFFGFVGLFTLFSCWPIGMLLHFLAVEKFQWPSDRAEVGALLLNVCAPSVPILTLKVL